MNQVVRKLSEDMWEGRDELEVLTFEIAGETFALEAFIVQEILDLFI